VFRSSDALSGQKRLDSMAVLVALWAEPGLPARGRGNACARRLTL
jgi:hypothetical protein